MMDGDAGGASGRVTMAMCAARDDVAFARCPTPPRGAAGCGIATGVADGVGAMDAGATWAGDGTLAGSIVTAAPATPAGVAIDAGSCAPTCAVRAYGRSAIAVDRVARPRA